MATGTISIIVGFALFIILKTLFKDNEDLEQKGFHGVDHEELFKEDLDFDPTWSVLPSNIHHSDDD